MPKPKCRKNTSFQNAMTKAVFLYGRPNKEKRTCIQQMLDTYIRMVNTYIRLLNSRSDLLLAVMKNSRKDSSLRQLEKSVRPEDVNSAFSQNAFDEAVVHLSKRYADIKTQLFEERQDIFTRSTALFVMAVHKESKTAMLQTVAKLSQNAKKQKKPFYMECHDALLSMTDEQFHLRMEEISIQYSSALCEFRVPVVRNAQIPVDMRIGKFEVSKNIKAPYVATFSNPLAKRKRLSIPVNTTKTGLRRLRQYDAASTFFISLTRSGKLKVSVAIEKKQVHPKTQRIEGVDIGIFDALHTSSNGAIGSMKPVIDFYRSEVEPAFAQLHSLRAKKRKLRVYLHRHKNLPEDVRRSLVLKIDRLEQMIRTAEAPYRKKRHYYQILDVTIKRVTEEYLSSISYSTLTALECLDIREMKKNRGTNFSCSMFARGKLSSRLMDKLNWYGYDFLQVPPDYTSQVCPVCSNLDSANRSGKVFHCTKCGYTDDADHNASVNIAARASDKEILQLKEKHRFSHKGFQKELKALYEKRCRNYFQAQKKKKH